MFSYTLRSPIYQLHKNLDNDTNNDVALNKKRSLIYIVAGSVINLIGLAYFVQNPQDSLMLKVGVVSTVVLGSCTSIFGLIKYIKTDFTYKEEELV